MFSLQHFNNFGLLLAGRLVGGIATSILCSNFESWLVCEHHKVSISPTAWLPSNWSPKSR